MGAAVPAIIIRKERDVVDTFMRSGATSPERGRSIESLGLENNFIMRRLRDRAVIRDAGPGLVYLDVGVWEAMNRTRRRIALLMLAIIALAGAVVYFTSVSRPQ